MLTFLSLLPDRGNIVSSLLTAPPCLDFHVMMYCVHVHMSVSTSESKETLLGWDDGSVNRVVMTQAGKSFFFLRFIYLLCIQSSVCMYTYSQMMVQDLITDGCDPPCSCWTLNSGPLEEQPVLLTSEPSLQPPWINS